MLFVSAPAHHQGRHPQPDGTSREVTVTVTITHGSLAARSTIVPSDPSTVLHYSRIYKLDTTPDYTSYSTTAATRYTCHEEDLSSEVLLSFDQTEV